MTVGRMQMRLGKARLTFPLCVLRPGQSKINFYLSPWPEHSSLAWSPPATPTHKYIGQLFKFPSLSLCSSQSEMEGSRLNWESVSGDIFRCLWICEILWDELFVLDLALSQNSRWLLGLLFYVLISARKIHSPRSVTPNPSHLCNI